MKRLLLVVMFAAQLAGCAGSQFRQNAKPIGIYVGVVGAIVVALALSGCTHCTFQDSGEPQ